MKRQVLQNSSFLWKRKSAPDSSSPGLPLAELSSLLVPAKLWVLAVFPRGDFACNAAVFACERLGHGVQLARTQVEAAEWCARRHQDLVIVDCRWPLLLSPREVCRAVRASPAGEHALLVAVILASELDSEEQPISRKYLEMDFNRYMVESSNVGVLTNELVMLEKNDFVAAIQHSINKKVFTAINISSDFVYITDNNFIIQYVNANTEQVLGLGAGADLKSKCEFKDERMVTDLAEGRDWTGKLFCHDVGGQSVVQQTRVTAIGLPGRPATHYMFVHNTSPTLDEKVPPQTAPDRCRKTAELGNPRPTRMDNTSNPIRRHNWKDGHTFRRNSSEREFVSTSGEASAHSSSSTGYSPRSQNTSPRLGTNSPRPLTSNSPRTRSVSPRPRRTNPSKSLTNSPQANAEAQHNPDENENRIPLNLVPSRPDPSGILGQLPVHAAMYELQASTPEMAQLLGTATKWDFEIFQLEKLAEQRPLVHMGLHLFDTFGCGAALGCDAATLRSWLLLLEAHYHRSNPYHNSTHAADVMQAAGWFLAADKLARTLGPLDRTACLVAAAAHDVDHPGKNAAFLCNSGHALALLYSDTSVLEMHHASATFHLTLAHPSVNIFKGLTNDQYRTLRKSVIEMILATEMSKHFEYLQQFCDAIFRTGSKMIGQPVEMEEAAGNYSADALSHIKRMTIKCADVSNPARPVHLCVEWALRISEEYFAQTDEEKARNLPIVMPLFDRETCSIPKGQVGFMDFIIKELFETWEAFIHLPELLEYMQKNFDFWKDLEEKNIATKEDIKTYLKSHLDLT